VTTNRSKKFGRVKTPTVLQMEAVECGAAALATILAYYGRIVSLEELRTACGVSRDGTKASNILKAARTYGMKVKGFSKEPAALRTLNVPFVVFWNFNHFLVVEGFHRGRVYLNDPATGPRVVTEEEFEQGFTGVVLVFEPGPKFEPGGNKPSLWRALYDRLRGSKAGMLYVFLASLALALLGLVVPLFGKVFVDYILVTRFNDWLMPLLIGMAVTCGLMTIITWLQRYYLLKLSIKLAVTSSYNFLRHVLRLPMEFFTQRYGGEVGGRMEINDNVAALISGQLTINALNVVMAVLYAAMMFYFNVMLTLISMLLAAVNVFALRFVARKRKDINVALLQEQGRMMAASMTGLQGIESVKATGGESDLFSRWAGHLAKVLVARQRMEVYSRGLSAVPSFVSTMASIAILGLGALHVIEGEMTIGALVAFQALMFGFMEPINQLVELGASVQEVEGQLNRLDDVLRYEIDPVLAMDDKNGVALVATGESLWRAEPAVIAAAENPKLAGRLDLKDITFGYSKLDPPLVERFNLTVKPGSRVALVGSSGSGKSTMAKVISGLYQPWSGTVLMDGRPRMETPRSIVTNSVAMVDQDFFLYEGTLREVLTMWDSTVPEEDIIQAAKDACIHDEIAARPGGYESHVEEGGRNFSSGQRQRLEIARALVGKPTVLVLDEATSALDPVTEQQIDENLRRRGCTCVIIAHRLSTIRDCDEIVVLDWGRVVQRGTHDELSQSRGLYRNLITTKD
jgi:NHLM bacteriocin system ABC transporter peptidase/ATP-binding protein